MRKPKDGSEALCFGPIDWSTNLVGYLKGSTVAKETEVRAVAISMCAAIRILLPFGRPNAELVALLAPRREGESGIRSPEP